MEKPLNAILHILTPVHIGCDEVYEPTNFVINERKSKLIKFDQVNFIKQLSAQERDRFSQICMQGDIRSILQILKFLSGKNIKGREIDVCAELVKHYKKIIALTERDNLRMELNQFIINRTAFNSHGDLPYIPGSSVKGSSRTAYLNFQAKKENIRNFSGKASDLERNLLKGNFSTDPFRMFKISDFTPLKGLRTKIVYVVNKKKKESQFDAGGPYQIMETICEGSRFKGFINIDKPEKKAEIIEPIQAKEMLKSMHDFYYALFCEELKICKEIQIDLSSQDSFLNQFNNEFGKSAFLLRIGRHSGAEAVTIEGNRRIKIIKGRRQTHDYSDHSTTLWLASEKSKPAFNKGLIPFGWAILRTVDDDEFLKDESEKCYVEEQAEISQESEAKQKKLEQTELAQEIKKEPFELLLENVRQGYHRPGDKHILQQAFDETKKFNLEIRKEFFRQLKLLPSIVKSIKENKRIKDFIKEQETF